MSISLQLPSIDETNIDKSIVIDQEQQKKFQAVATDRLVSKLDWRLIPFLFLLEMGSYLIRISIGHAKLMGMNSDLHLSQIESQWAVSLFFLSYLVFELPSIFLMRYLRPATYLPLSIFAWGGITVGMAFVRNAQQLLAVRFLLGIAQAGFFPGIIIYFSLWYRKKDHTMRIAILFGAAIISGAFGSILAYGFRQMDGLRDLNSWQWMFLLEGLIMIPLGITTCLFLSDIPDTVQWLDINEKILLTNILRDDTCVVQLDNTRLSWPQVFHVFIDWRIYLYALIAIGDIGVIKYLLTYLPSVVQDMGTPVAIVHLMTAPPYVFAFVSCLLIAYSSSKKNEHGFHLMFSLSVAILGFILLTTLNNPSEAVMYVIICIACCGVFSALPILLSWLTNNVDGHTKKSVAIGFIMGIGQLGGIIFPLVDDDNSTSRRNNLICLGVLAVSLTATIILRICLIAENRRRNLLTPDEYDREAAMKEACDWHPDVRYIL